MLQRFLHTLKGGARMAGVLPMGDLSHALETLLSRIAEGHSRATPAALDLVQRGLDELQQMRDAIDAGRAIGAARGLIAQLEGFEAAASLRRPCRAGRRPRSRRAASAPPAEPRRADVPRRVVAELERVPTVDLTDADFARAR